MTPYGMGSSFGQSGSLPWQCPLPASCAFPGFSLVGKHKKQISFFALCRHWSAAIKTLVYYYKKSKHSILRDSKRKINCIPGQIMTLFSSPGYHTWKETTVHFKEGRDVTWSKDISSLPFVLFNIFLGIFSLFQHTPVNLQTKNLFSQFSQVVMKPQSYISLSHPITSLLLPPMVTIMMFSHSIIFPLSLRCNTISSLVHIINLLSTAEKDIPWFSLAHIFFIIITNFLFSLVFVFLCSVFSLLWINMKVVFTWMSEAQPATLNQEETKGANALKKKKSKTKQTTQHNNKKRNKEQQQMGSARAIDRKWWKKLCPTSLKFLQDI